MAKNIARLLKTDMMADFDLKALAQLLQSRGRGGDTILAHITQREADKLAREGGADTINPDTGLPEFYDGEEFSSFEAPVESEAPAPVTPLENLAPAGAENAPAEGQYSNYGAGVPEASAPAQLPSAVPAISETGFEGKPGLPSVATRGPTDGIQATGMEPPAPQEKGVFEDVLKDMTPEQKRNLLLKGGLGLGTGIISALQGRRAARQAEGAKGEIQALARPYQQAGQALQAQAQQGQLTPDRAAQMQAAQAQIAQGVQQRGGVGAQQAATQLAQFRQQLLNDQYNYGLKIAQIGDSYAQRAIATGLTQDKEMSTAMQGLTSALGGFMGSKA